MSNPTIDLRVEGDHAWSDLREKHAAGQVHHTTRFGLVALAGGMTSGAPSVAIRIDLPDGRAAITETSLAALLTACDAIVAKHGDPRRSAPAPATREAKA